MTDSPIPEGDLTAAESEELLLMCGHALGPEPLSPAAQAVLDAFNGFHELTNRRLKIAAALRAAALYCKRDTLLLLSLADELEGQGQLTKESV